MNTSTLPTLIQRFFRDRLTAQLQASPNTVAGYRDTFRLLLRFASQRRDKPPTKLRIEDLDAALIGDFLTHVEKVRRNSARRRNTRLAAIRSFYRYVAMNEPEHALHCQRILAMPSKRYVRRTVDFINRTEMEALLSAPDQSTWIGRRDRAILLLALQTGLRVSELINLNCRDVILGTGAHIRCEGKGRKQRSTPLRRDTVKTIEAWLKERAGSDDDPVFPTIRGVRLSRDAVEHIVRKYTLAASKACATDDRAAHQQRSPKKSLPIISARNVITLRSASMMIRLEQPWCSKGDQSAEQRLIYGRSDDPSVSSSSM
jgi:integrase/recombinase XerD